MDVPTLAPATVLAVDPGRSKCGIAVVCASNPMRTLFKSIVETRILAQEVTRLIHEMPSISSVVIGDGTASREVGKTIAAAIPNVPISLIDEHGSSERARRRHLLEHAPTGWRRLVPIGLRTPGGAYDDTVAEILAQDFFATLKKNV